MQHSTLQLHNPHSVLAVFETRPHDVVDLRLPSHKQPSPGWEDVERMATLHRVPILRGDPREGRRTSKHSQAESGRTGVTRATVRERADVTMQDLFANAKEQRNGRYGLWLALDQIQDPHNVGAVFRTAAFFGIRGIVITRDRSAPLNATVYDVASGGMEHVPFSNLPNLARAIEQAKEAGLWALGASEHAERDVAEIPHDRPWLLVLGNEEKGLRRLTFEKCDDICRLSAKGSVGSLNVSVAAGVLMAILTGTGGAARS